MFEINEKEKTVVYSERWSIEDVKCIHYISDFFTDYLSNDEYFIILKNAVETAEFWDQNLTDLMIENTIKTYIEENY